MSPPLPSFIGNAAPTTLGRATPTVQLSSQLAQPVAFRSTPAEPTFTLATEPQAIPQIIPPHGDSAIGKDLGKVIVLFRTDLRLDDHPALTHALEDASTIIPVYIFDPRHFGTTSMGFQRTGEYRARFLIDSVSDLRVNLRKLGSDLIIRRGYPEQLIPDLCKKWGARAVYMHREISYDEKMMELDMEKRLKKKNIELKMFWTNGLYEETDLPFALEDMPDVYSEFREKVQNQGKIRTPLPVPESMNQVPKSIDDGHMPTLKSLGIPESSKNIRNNGVSVAAGGETEAGIRVKKYIEGCLRCITEKSPRAKTSVHLGADFSCRISPWLAIGCVSPRRLYAELKKHFGRDHKLYKQSTYFELVWRDFFRYITCKYSTKRVNASARAHRVQQRRMATRSNVAM